MDRANILKLALFMVFMMLNPKMECQFIPIPPIQPRPLCISQFALVNHACAMLPFTPLPPPSPPSPPLPPSPPSPDGPEHGHRHRHEHRHRHRHGHREMPMEEECCRWLNSVDSECVCDLLVRLPPFLSRPIHQFTVLVGESCSVTFQCGSRLSA